MNLSSALNSHPDWSSRKTEGCGKSIVRVVDDDDSFRLALHRLLRAEGFEVKAYGSVAEVLLDGATGPGCFVLDLGLPDASGLELQAALARMPEPQPVIFLSGQGDVQSTASAMKQGAIDFLTKPVDAEKLFGSVRSALLKDMEGRSERGALRELRDRFSGLSERERAVFSLVVDGCPNREIANSLGIAERTVKGHRAHIMEKLNARSVPDLVRMAGRLVTALGR